MTGMMERKVLLVSAVCLAELFAAVFHTAAADAVQVSNQPQLFLDDYLVARMTNLQRAIKQPTKHPQNPLIVQDLPWEKRLISIYGTVFFDEQRKKFRCWYTAGEHNNGIPDTPEAPVTAEYFICYAESEDGIHWKKPLVSQEQFGLHERHNIVVPHGHGWCVLPSLNPREDQQRFLGAGGAWFGSSADGIRWETQNWRDAVAKNDTSTSLVHWNDEYLAFVRYQVKDPDWPGVMRGIGLSVSRDFESWSPKKLIFTTDKEDGYPWTQPYGLAVTPYGDQLIGQLWLLHLDKIEGNNSLGDEDTQLVVSRDGKNWHRVADRTTFLASTPGSWDAGRIHAPATSMFVKNDLVHIYYSASETRHGSGSWGSPGIGLATLPADRFVGIRQVRDQTAGMLQTQPLEFSGNSLLVNADADSKNLQVELLDRTGAVVPGFDRHSCRLVAHDHLRFHVFWEQNGRRKSLSQARSTGDSLRIRFILKQGELFAFQIVD